MGRVAALSPAQQRWFRSVLASIRTMEDAVEEKPRRVLREAESEAARPRRKGLEDLLRGDAAVDEEYPELADELKGIAEVAELLKESGRERRRVGEEILRLLESEPVRDEQDEDEDGRYKSGDGPIGPGPA